MKKAVGVVLGLLPISVSAECVPVPDCASIGYTETSCEGDSLKCPFDATKLKCFPCDSSFRYTCSGDNIKNPIGNACNNKYVSCECDTLKGYIFSNGECVCDVSCSVGNIYYSDGTCSSCYLSNKTPVGVIIKENELVINLTFAEMSYSPNGIDITNITNQGNRSETYNDFAGKQHTLAMVEQFGANADTSTYAGIYCYNYAPTGLETTKNNWYFPAIGEIHNYIYKNFAQIQSTFVNKLNKSIDYTFWSSTELSGGDAWHITAKSGYPHYNFYNQGKETIYYVLCMLEI